MKLIKNKAFACTMSLVIAGNSFLPGAKALPCVESEESFKKQVSQFVKTHIVPNITNIIGISVLALSAIDLSLHIREKNSSQGGEGGTTYSCLNTVKEYLIKSALVEQVCKTFNDLVKSGQRKVFTSTEKYANMLQDIGYGFGMCSQRSDAGCICAKKYDTDGKGGCEDSNVTAILSGIKEILESESSLENETKSESKSFLYDDVLKKFRSMNTDSPDLYQIAQAVGNGESSVPITSGVFSNLSDYMYDVARKGPYCMDDVRMCVKILFKELIYYYVKNSSENIDVNDFMKENGYKISA